MNGLDLSPTAQQWVNLVLMWIGFGTLVGLLARAVMPGRESATAVATLAYGIAGSALGLLICSIAYRDAFVNPISPLGILSATGATLALMLGHRLIRNLFAPHNSAEDSEAA